MSNWDFEIFGVYIKRTQSKWVPTGGIASWSTTIRAKNTWGPQIEAIFYQEVIREGTATVLVVRCCFASLRQLIAHVCRTGHQICKMPAHDERSFGTMISKRAHKRRVSWKSGANFGLQCSKSTLK